MKSLWKFFRKNKINKNDYFVQTPRHTYKYLLTTFGLYFESEEFFSFVEQMDFFFVENDDIHEVRKNVSIRQKKILNIEQVVHAVSHRLSLNFFFKLTTIKNFLRKLLILLNVDECGSSSSSSSSSLHLNQHFSRIIMTTCLLLTRCIDEKKQNFIYITSNQTFFLPFFQPKQDA